jgi:hypothetical protein
MKFSFAGMVLLGIQLLQTAENTGIKMTIQHGPATNLNRRTVYVENDRKRTEYRNSFGVKQADGSIQQVDGPPIISITRCDLGQSFELNLDSREYSVTTYPPNPLTEQERKARGLDKPISFVSDKPTVRIETTTTDTGERKEIFGRTARHVVTTRKEIPLEGAHSGPQESVTDAWYIDFDEQLSCDRKWPTQGRGKAYLHASGSNQPVDRPEFVSIGEPERGFALNSVTTTKGRYLLQNGTTKETNSRAEMQVTQFEEGPLDPSLFQVPSTFNKVDHIERNPDVLPRNQPNGFWERVKTDISNLFNR